MSLTQRSCPACAFRQATLVHHLALRTPDGHPLGDGYDVVACDRCGSGFADVAINQGYYDLYYGNMAKYADEATLSDIEGPGFAEAPHTLKRLEETADRIATLVPDRSARIIDVGCANGTLLASLRRRGFSHLRGVDPSAQSAQVAAVHNGVQVDVGTFSNMPPGLGLFDCVCLIGVLEHVWDMDEAMHVVNSLLRPGGIVFVGIPDAGRYLDPYIGPFEDFSTEHVNHLSNGSLAVLAERFGLAGIWESRADSELAPGAISAGINLAWKQDPDASASPIARDEPLVEVLQQFTLKSLADFTVIDEHLRAQLLDSRHFALWGMGELSMKLLASTVLAELEAVAFLDGNNGRRGIHYGGIPVSPPESLPSSDVPIVIGSLLRADSIVAAARRLNLSNPIVTLV